MHKTAAKVPILYEHQAVLRLPCRHSYREPDIDSRVPSLPNTVCDRWADYVRKVAANATFYITGPVKEMPGVIGHFYS
jgi:hypothetical protein